MSKTGKIINSAVLEFLAATPKNKPKQAPMPKHIKQGRKIKHK